MENDPVMRELDLTAERLRWVRKRYKLNQDDVCEAIGARVKQYSNWETGRQVIPIPYAIKFARTYKVSLDFLYLGFADSLPAHMAKAWLSK